jgi:hemerythrin-like domain-containing protein
MKKVIWNNKEFPMDSSSELAPSAVRKIILDEHAILREKMVEIESFIKIKNSANLIKLAREFVEFFLVHISKEERLLRPVLKDIDAWGAVRVDRLNKEHAQQRQVTEGLLTLINGEKTAQIIPALEKFISELYIDMSQEEKDFLNADVLKDDPITVGTFSG